MSRLGSIIVASALGLASAAAAATQDQTAFLKKAIQGDNSEIMLGRLAEQRAATAGGRDFGRTLVQDHTQARDQAGMVAQSLGVKPPTEPMAEAKAEYKRLQGLSGVTFDREFARYMVKDHQQDISDFRKQADKNDGQVSDLARTTLPVLEKHLHMAEHLQGSV